MKDKAMTLRRPNPFRSRFTVTPVRSGRHPKPWAYTISDDDGVGLIQVSATTYRSAEEAWEAGVTVVDQTNVERTL